EGCPAAGRGRPAACARRRRWSFGRISPRWAGGLPRVGPDGAVGLCGVQRPIVNVSWMTFEIGTSWPVTIPGAVPWTREAVKVVCLFLPKKPGTPTSQSLITRVRPWWRDTELSWKTPARLAFGPPAARGVVDKVTTRPGAFGSGIRGPNVAAGGRFSPGR